MTKKTKKKLAIGTEMIRSLNCLAIIDGGVKSWSCEYQESCWVQCLRPE